LADLAGYPDRVFCRLASRVDDTAAWQIDRIVEAAGRHLA
jgi:hypothetical protein